MTVRAARTSDVLIVRIVACLVFFGASFAGCASGNFRRGDAIVVDEIAPPARQLKLGDIVVLRGHYTLASEPQAHLMVSLTTYGSGRPTRTSPRSQMTVPAGSGVFELEYVIRDRGSLHISFYPAAGGANFGRLDIADVGL